MSQFEALIRKETNNFTARRRAARMLRVAVEEEQAGEGARWPWVFCKQRLPIISEWPE